MTFFLQKGKVATSSQITHTKLFNLCHDFQQLPLFTVRHCSRIFRTLQLKNIHFPSLSTSHPPICFCSVQRRGSYRQTLHAFTPILLHHIDNYSIIQTLLRIYPNPLLLSTIFSAPNALYPSSILCTTSSISCHLRPQLLKTIHFP